jgi:uncharacterized repeat protein (TIGR02543 family)
MGGLIKSWPYTHGTTVSFTLYARWTANTLVVTYNTSGGSAVPSSSTKTGAAAWSSGFVPRTPTRNGYAFAAWYTAARDGTQVVAGYMHGNTSNFTLYARWNPLPLTITYDTGEGDTITPPSITYTGDYYWFPGWYPTPPTRAGYAFAGWYTKATGGSRVLGKVKHGKTKNFTLYARWRQLN